MLVDALDFLGEKGHNGVAGGCVQARGERESWVILLSMENCDLECWQWSPYNVRHGYCTFICE